MEHWYEDSPSTNMAWVRFWPLFIAPRGYSQGTLDFFFHQKPKLEMICCVLVEKLCSAKYTETYYYY